MKIISGALLGAHWAPMPVKLGQTAAKSDIGKIRGIRQAQTPTNTGGTFPKQALYRLSYAPDWLILEQSGPLRVGGGQLYSDDEATERPSRILHWNPGPSRGRGGGQGLCWQRLDG